MKRVLITGGAGFIGSHLCERLLDRGCEVVIVDDLSSGRRSNLAAVADRVSFIEADVRELSAHRDEFAGVDTVFHLAALISGHDSLLEPEAYLDANVRGTLEVIRVCRALDHPRVVFASSSTVYGQNASRPARSETDVPDPITVYALSKLAGEHLLGMYAGLYCYDPVILRLFNVYGPRQRPDHPYANVTCKFSHAAANGLPVKLYGDGEQSRDFVYVSDVVNALVHVAISSRHRIYNVGTGTDTAILELLRTAESLANQPLQVERLAAWPNDIRCIRADVTRLREDIEIGPMTPLADGLRHTVEWFRALARA